MDLLSCETRSRCIQCHHYSPSTGCALLAAVDAYEASLAPPTPAGPVTLAWTAPRDAVEA